VNPKESWYSISRMYSASPKELVTLNQTSLEMGLAITQKIKIPLTTNNFIQSEKKSPKEVLIPLYHVISEKEGLYRISLLYKKVPINRLKEWNKLSSEVLNVGNSLLIGYLKVKKDSLTILNQIKESSDLRKEDSVINKSNNKLQSIVTEQPKQTLNIPLKQVVIAEKQFNKTGKNILNEEKPVAKPVIATNEKKVSGNENLFFETFNLQNKGKPQNNLNGIADIFKSSSGWNDGKYYVLMNSLAPGTIVKIVAISTNIAIYAKVLGGIPPGKENDGLDLRISNAASAQLKAEVGRFDVKISW